MKKLLILALALLMIVSLAACKGNDPGSTGTNPSTNSTGDNQQSGNESGNGNTSQSGNNAEAAKLTGKLNLIELDDRDPSVLRGVTVKGNCAGTADFNSKEPSLTDVRCIFELNEWVYFYPDTDATYGLRVWILKHRDDQEYYNTAKFSDLDPNFANYCDLHYPEDAENPDETEWGSFYLNKEECEPGYYDFVFTYEGKAIATLLTRFYAENELTVKSDAELEALMHEWAAPCFVKLVEDNGGFEYYQAYRGDVDLILGGKVKASGFTVDAEEEDQNVYGVVVYTCSAYNADGYRVEVTFASGTAGITINK